MRGAVIFHETAGHVRRNTRLEKLLGKMVEFVEKHELNICQSYSLNRSRLVQQLGRYAHVKQFKRKRFEQQSDRVGRLQR